MYADEEVVVLSEIFPHAINDGYLPPRLTRVLSFNDENVRNLEHLTQMIENFEGEWMTFRVDSNLQQTIILDARGGAVWEATKEICMTYSVPYYKPRGERKEGEEEEVPPWARLAAAAAAAGK